MENNNSMIYKIYEENMEKFEGKMKMLARKANKIGNGNVSFKVIGEEFVEEKKEINIWNGCTKKINVMYKKIIVEITGAETPQINGWAFMGTINHYSEAGNIINKIPSLVDLEIPERFRTTGQYCEHCNSSRRRNDTYILWNESTGEFKQIGKTCLKDFLGHNSPENIAKYAEYLFDMRSNADEFERIYSEGIPKHVKLVEWLTLSQAVIRNIGYISKAKAQEQMSLCTTDIVYDQMFHSDRMKERDIITANDEDMLLAEKVIAYIKTIEPITDYEQNLKILVSSDVIALRVKGYATSMIPYYMKALDLIKEKEIVIPSKHIGSVGDKIEVELTIEKVKVWENVFGVVKFHLMKDKEGNVFTWKTSSKTLTEGATVKIKGTVKAHTEYKEVNQTELLRVKVI